MDIKEFRKQAHELVDWMADFLEGLEDYPVFSDMEPGEIMDKLPSGPPEAGEPMEKIFTDFREIILPGITHWQHPSFFAYFPANSSPPSVLAEMLMSTLGAQCMSWITSPAATELEERVMEWIGDMLCLPEGFTGVIQDTASTATLCALITAREKTTDFVFNEKGYSEDDLPRMAVYTSSHSHSSIEKGAKIAGFGREMIRKIDVDENFAMIPESLEAAVREDVKAGITPCCVIAAVGTTSTLALDPLVPIGDICERYGIWLHVDAAMAGTAAVLPEKRYILDGMENADSFVFNPHKWMFTNFDCSAYYVKDPRHLVQTFTIDPEYLKTDYDMKVKNYRDWGIPLGRRFRALKLWFVIRSYGVEGIRARVREHIKIASEFAEHIRKDKDFELLAPVDLNLVCFRLNPQGSSLEPDAVNELNKNLMDALNKTGKLFLTHTKLNGQFTLRMSIGGVWTEKRHIEDAWKRIKETSAQLTRKG